MRSLFCSSWRRACWPRCRRCADDVLEEVIVTATLREQSLLEVPVSVTVLDEQTLRDRGPPAFRGRAERRCRICTGPAATSRPRFFQIRGIGEREQ